jgi:tetratricopeptide (TPR) repeat protein
LTIQPNLHPTRNNRGIALSNLGCHEEAIASFEEVLKIQPDNSYAWNNRGVALFKLGRLDEAIASLDKALKFKPKNADAFYNKACCYALQDDLEQAIENLRQAINLSPDKYQEMAKTDSYFDSVREDEQFQTLIQEESDREEGEIDEREWLQAAASNPAFDFLNNPEEDIYNSADSLQLTINYPATLPEALQQTREQFEQEAKWAMAVKLFEMKRISSGTAAQLVGTDRVTFLLNLHRYGAAMIDLEEEELLSDLENA